ncbi:HAMP domain-containing histidine kinase [bacterium]|nr:HAMP domain-containing histidine kinase [bacterium]
MSENSSKELIDDVVKLSAGSNPLLKKKVDELIKLFNAQEKQTKKLEKQNQFLLKQWDKKNILTSQRDAKKDKMLEQQSKMAAMGEMMDAVAHQWKQPLNSLSMITDILKDDYEHNLVNEHYIDDLTKTVHFQIDHMVNTLKEFRTFFRPSAHNEEFTILECVQSVQVLMKDELLSQQVHLTSDIDEFIKINGIKNEFVHLFLNLISNSIDAFNEKNVSSREIKIRCYSENENIYIEFEDNGGGIPQKVIEHIFKPNVTTKKEGKGTGIGLYMSSQIVQKYHGKINVHNTDTGAFFTITLR